MDAILFYAVKCMGKKIFVQTFIIFFLFMGAILFPSVLSKELSQASYYPTDSVLMGNHSTSVQSSTSNYYAVIAACSRSKNPKYNLPRKPFPPFSDEKLSVLYNVLVQLKNWNESHVLLLLNDQATKQNITAALVQMAGIIGPNDYFLFSWSGHGTEVPDTNADENSSVPNDAFDEAICPYDILIDNNSSKQNVITDDELGSYFSNITCKGMCLVFDCCLSGDMVDRNATNGTMGMQCGLLKTSAFTDAFCAELKGPKSTDVNGNNRVVLMSTSPGLLERGIYLTGFPLEVGIAFACTHPTITDRNKDGVISAEEAFSVARTLVYAQSSIFWIGSWLYSYFALLMKYGIQSFLLASLVVLDMIFAIQMILKPFTNHFMGNFPTMQDDYSGDLPLVEG